MYVYWFLNILDLQLSTRCCPKFRSFHFALWHSMIGLENLRHFRNQSNTKLKPTVSQSRFLRFTPTACWLRALIGSLRFYTCCDWLLNTRMQFFFFFLFTSFLSEFHCLSIGAKPSGAVLGEVVMEGNVVVFDRANQRIGFAPSNMSHPDVGQCGKRGPGKGFYWYGSVILVGCSRLTASSKLIETFQAFLSFLKWR